MNKSRGFLLYERLEEKKQPPMERIRHYKDFIEVPEEKEISEQGARCMDCGIPFCHSGCPLGNLIPDFNQAVHQNEWQKALEILHSTNNFPEFTGRLCPAPCESACVLGIIKPPVAIELIEKYIPERGFQENWIKPQPPKFRTGKEIAIVGSGPSGLAAAQQLNRAGHTVTVFERDSKVGGLLRYGIPDFKLEKWIIDRRLDILEAEGIVFKTNVNVGVNYSVEELEGFDAILLCGGATNKRQLKIPGSDLPGVVQAMDYLKKSNLVQDNQELLDNNLEAKNKHVIVIGGGDTGSDCIGTANRQGAKSVVNFEIMSRPSEERSDNNPWPYWPFTFKITSSHEEGVSRNWCISTKEFLKDEDGKLCSLKTVDIKWSEEQGQRKLVEIPGTEREWPCDLALLSLGFTGPENYLINQLGIDFDHRTQGEDPIKYHTSNPKIFAAGDMRRGQSLIVWAISEGREAARCIDTYLMEDTNLPTKGKGDLPLSNSI